MKIKVGYMVYHRVLNKVFEVEQIKSTNIDTYYALKGFSSWVREEDLWIAPDEEDWTDEMIIDYAIEYSKDFGKVDDFEVKLTHEELAAKRAELVAEKKCVTCKHFEVGRITNTLETKMRYNGEYFYNSADDTNPNDSHEIKSPNWCALHHKRLPKFSGACENYTLRKERLCTGAIAHILGGILDQKEKDPRYVRIETLCNQDCKYCQHGHRCWSLVRKDKFQESKY